jgi:hypothetical protein
MNNHFHFLEKRSKKNGRKYEEGKLKLFHMDLTTATRLKSMPAIHEEAPAAQRHTDRQGDTQ